MYLSSLEVRNFRSLKNTKLEFRPGVTVLVGQNAAGKTNIVDAISFVEDAIYNGIDDAVRYRGGASLIHRLSEGGTKSRIEISLGFRSEDITAEYQIQILIDENGEANIDSESIRGREKPTNEEIEIILTRGRFSSPAQKILSDLASDPYSPLLSVMGDSRYMSEVIAQYLYEEPKKRSAASRIAFEISDFVSKMEFYHLNPIIMRSPQPLSGSATLEADGSNLATVVRRIVQERSSSYFQLRDALGHVVPDIKDIRVEGAGGYFFVQLLHQAFSSDDNGRGWLDLLLESDGTVRVLGLLVALYQDPPPSLIVIEEPELQVHVGALGILADTINEVSESCQVMITTHSADILDHVSADEIRVIANVNGQTVAGEPRPAQLEALRESLFTPGEIHRIEGLSVE